MNAVSIRTGCETIAVCRAIAAAAGANRNNLAVNCGKRKLMLPPVVLQYNSTTYYTVVLEEYNTVVVLQYSSTTIQ